METKNMAADEVIKKMITGLNRLPTENRTLLRRNAGRPWERVPVDVKIVFWTLFSEDEERLIRRMRKEPAMFTVASIACCQDPGSGDIRFEKFLRNLYHDPTASCNQQRKIQNFIARPIIYSGVFLQELVQFAKRAINEGYQLNIFALAHDMWFWGYNDGTRDKWGRTIAYRIDEDEGEES